MSGKETTVYRFLTKENSDEAIRHSLVGSRSYVGKYFGPHESTKVEFKGDMPEFKPAGEAIGMKAFGFGLAIRYDDSRAWSRTSRLKSFLDTGLLCGIAPEGDLESLVDELNIEGARVARKAADKYTEKNPAKPRFVAGAIGPTNKTLSLSPDVNDPGFRAVTYQEVVLAYEQQVEGLIKGGVDILLVETVFDT